MWLNDNLEVGAYDMGKLKFILKRLAMAMVTLLLITLVVFFVIQLPPGDFVDYMVTNMVAEGEQVTQADVHNLKVMYGMNKPFIGQYVDWLKGIVTGDWGVSLYYKKSVLKTIGETLGTTLMLSFVTLIFTYIVSIPIAIYSAKHQYSIGDYIVTFIGFIGMAVMGLPKGGITSLASFGNYVKHLVIPILVIGLGGTCSLIRSIRAQMMAEQVKPYVLCTRAKGVSENKITYKYQMRSVLNPVVSGLGGMISSVFNGSTITAIVLMLPTQGPVLLKALQTQDVYLSGGILLISATLVVLGNLLSDLLLMVMDPRIRSLEEGNK